MTSEYKGLAVGGPLDGREITHVGPKGFVHHDLDTGKVVVYDRDEEGNFVAGDEQDVDYDKLAKAQEDDGRKILAFGTFPEFQDDPADYDIPEITFDEDDDEVDNG